MEYHELWPDMVDAVSVFMALETQWTMTMTGLPTGLNYSSIEPVARMLEVSMTPQLFLDLRALERGARSYFVKRAKT